MRHPAKYSKELFPILDALLPKQREARILDPFAGTGRLKELRPWCTLLEIEPEWGVPAGAVIGDACDMPFGDSSFDCICTSPTYGNRMADSFVDHQEEKNYKRNTYTHCLGRKLSHLNSGGMQWGPKYRDLHEKAWKECWRVLRPGGTFILNIANLIREGKEVMVTEWHLQFLLKMGLVLISHERIRTPGFRQGTNRNLRVGYESVIFLLKTEGYLL